MSDLIWLGFYFLLRPGEYLHTTKGRYPFRLQDVEFQVANRTYLAPAVPLEDLPHATSAGLTFTMQKNGIPGEVINLSCSADPRYCPVQALARRVRHLRTHHATNSTPLYTYYDTHGATHRVTDRHLTAFLRIAAALLELDVITTAGALRCTGASALLEGKTPVELIKLLGRWRSDEVFRYLHTQSPRLMQPLADTMLAHAT
jgi:hypothetical protein